MTHKLNVRVSLALLPFERTDLTEQALPLMGSLEGFTAQILNVFKEVEQLIIPAIVTIDAPLYP